MGDGSLRGLAYVVDNGDTTITEHLELKRINGTVFYIPTVPHNPGPVRFRLIQIDQDEVVFENLAHDFPNRIIYHSPANDSLVVRIEGATGQQERARDFRFARKHTP